MKLRNYTVGLLKEKQSVVYGAPLAYPMSLRKVTGPATAGLLCPTHTHPAPGDL